MPLAPYSASIVVLCAFAAVAAASEISKDQARTACRRQFGGMSELVRIDAAKGYIYCRSKREIERIHIGKSLQQSAEQPESPPEDTPVVAVPQVLPPASSSDCTTAPGGECAVETSSLERTAQPPSDRQILLENAKRLCVDRFGPSSSVHHLDFGSWEVLCNVPEK